MNTNGKISIALLLSIFLVACQSGETPDASTYTVSGAITGKSIDGVTVLLSGSSLTNSLAAVTKADGKYSFAGIKPGTYKVQPSKTGILFTPAFQDIEVKNASLTVPDIAADYPEPMTCDDATKKWCRPEPAVTEPINSIWGANGSDLWFVGNKTTILRYTNPVDKAATWSRVDAGTGTTKKDFYAVWGNSSGDVWISGASVMNSGWEEIATIHRYQPGGSPQWTTSSGIGYDIQALWGLSSSIDVSYAGCNGLVGTQPADGGSRQAQTLPTSVHVYGAWAASPTDQWIVGRNLANDPSVNGPEGASSAVGVMYRQKDGGAWQNADINNGRLYSTEVENALTARAWVSDIRGTSASDVWAVGTKGFVSHFDGTQWKLVNAGANAQTNLYGVWPVSANEVWVAGGVPGTNTGTLLKYTKAGGTESWQSVTLPADAGLLFRVRVDSATNSVWLSGKNGILRYKP